MGQRKRQIVKLASMTALTFSFFVAEVIFGHITGSLALIGDSYHMISDVLALVIGLSCLAISTKSSTQNTFGWARAEILGALVNSVFLAALCFTIFIEAVERLIHPNKIEEPILLLTTGCVGLVINVFGLLVFCNETYGHGHSHGGAGDKDTLKKSSGSLLRKAFSTNLITQNFESHNVPETLINYHGETEMRALHKSLELNTDEIFEPKSKAITGSKLFSGEGFDTEVYSMLSAGGVRLLPSQRYHSFPLLNDLKIKEKYSQRNFRHGDWNGGSNTMISNCQSAKASIKNLSGAEARKKCYNYGGSRKMALSSYFDSKNININNSTDQMNIKGVFLHILGDALGSVVVIISALIAIYKQEGWTLRVDPILSIVMVLIILSTTFPLFKQSSLILLQHVPGHIHVANLAERLSSEIEGVLGIHELHIWQLVGSRLIASVHVKCKNAQEYKEISKKIKEFFHNEGIHSTTVQPEFVDDLNEGRLERCSLECGPDKSCEKDRCCTEVKKRFKSLRRNFSKTNY